MTDQQKIRLIDEMLKDARDPQMIAISKVMVEPHRRFRVCEMLVEDNGEQYWISIEYPDR